MGQSRMTYACVGGLDSLTVPWASVASLSVVGRTHGFALCADHGAISIKKPTTHHGRGGAGGFTTRGVILCVLLGLFRVLRSLGM